MTAISSDLPLAPQRISSSYRAAKVSCTFRVDSAFPDSTDSHVYIWHANGGKPLHVLQGHEDTVNCVAWNPIPRRRMIASASDDHTVYVYLVTIETSLADWPRRIWQPFSEAGAVLDTEAGDVSITNGSGVTNGGGTHPGATEEHNGDAEEDEEEEDEDDDGEEEEEQENLEDVGMLL